VRTAYRWGVLSCRNSREDPGVEGRTTSSLFCKKKGGEGANSLLNIVRRPTVTNQGRHYDVFSRNGAGKRRRN
jgi:hypothetical protein